MKLVSGISSAKVNNSWVFRGIDVNTYSCFVFFFCFVFLVSQLTSRSEVLQAAAWPKDPATNTEETKHKITVKT